MNARQKHLLKLGVEKEVEAFEKIRRCSKKLLILIILHKYGGMTIPSLADELKKEFTEVPYNFNFFFFLFLKELYGMKLITDAKRPNSKIRDLVKVSARGNDFITKFNISEKMADKARWAEDSMWLVLSFANRENNVATNLFASIFEKKFTGIEEYSATNNIHRESIIECLSSLANSRLITYEKSRSGLPVNVKLTKYGESFPNYPKS